jgi:hypothetical protein
LQALADYNVPVVLLFASPVPLVELHGTLKFPNIDWTQSRSLPQAMDAGSEVTDQLLTLLAERRHPRRRTPLSKSKILRWVGSNAILPPSMMLNQMAFKSRVGSSEANPTARTLSIAELRAKRFEALPVARYVRAARKDGASVKRDRVDCSVFAPPAVQIKQPFKLQALLHLQDDLEKATRKAEAADPSTERLTTETLQVEIKRGSRVELSLECPGLQVRDRRKTIQWLGDPKQAVWNAAYRGAQGAGAKLTRVGD